MAGRFCPSCGSQRTRDGRFCERCGVSLEPPVAAPVGPSTASPAPLAVRRTGPPWSRLLVGALVLVLVVAGIALVSPDSETPSLGLGAATAADPDPARVVTSPRWGEAPADQILVLLADGRVRADAERIASQLGAKIVGEVALVGLYQLATSARTAAELDASVAAAGALDGVAIALANQAVIASDTPGTRCDPLTDPSYLKGTNARGYEVIGLRGAWDAIAAAGVALQPVKVGLLDSALYTKTGEFDGAVKATGDTTTDAFTWQDGSAKIGGIGHGTAVAQLIGADPNDGGASGVAGILGDKLQMRVIDIFRKGKEYVPATADPKDPRLITWGSKTYAMRTFADVVRQIDGGATVINMSFGNPKLDANNLQNAALWRAFLTKMATLHPNVLFVASAGNANGDLDGGLHTPGGLKLPNLISVGSVDADGKRSSFSNYSLGGDGEVTLAAPGNDVMVGVDSNGEPIVDAGTSFAAPQVTAAAALLRSLDPTLSAARLKEILAATASPGVETKDARGNAISVPVPKEIGGRVLRVDRAVLQVVNDVRLRADPKAVPLTLEGLRALAVIDVRGVQKDALSWTVVADLPAVGEKGTDISIDFSGAALVGGMSTQRATAPGAVQWPLTFPKAGDSAFVTVRRLDSKACARVSLRADPEVAVAKPTPTAVARGTVREALLAAVRRLGLPESASVRGRDEAGIQCQSIGQSCSYSRAVWAGDPSTFVQSLTSVGFTISQLPSADAARGAADPKSADGSGDGWRQQAHRGLTMWTQTTEEFSYGDGVWQGPTARTVLRLAAGALVVTVEGNASCSARTDKVPRCGLPSLPGGTPVLDVLLDETVKAGLVPAGTVR